MKQLCWELALRVPEWIESGTPTVKAARAGKAVRVVWAGRYVQTSAVNAGDTVVPTFPIAAKRIKQTIAGLEYTLLILGNTVVSMSPASGVLAQV